MRDKEFMKLEKQNAKLKELLEESLQFIEAYRLQAKHWEDMYNQLDRYCRYKYND
ncbi:hypothetical protein [Clostridium sp. HV4-5-A1G]|uniref:hypothetical protein n=1 Tax=Clostridium sp. HV4-5-A1G TaxID=2004595 RepID=UPI001684177D|nr:hypothetical protein [Clostridium sp. HV4-5-A1G]